MIALDKGKFSQLAGILVLAILFASCTPQGGDPTLPTAVTVEETPGVTQEIATATMQATPTSPPRRLTICMADEPETLFIYGSDSLAQRHVLQAIYDGPIDRVGYEYQPVILEKLPSLAEGDAMLEPVPVELGDWIVNSTGQLVRLELGEMVQPFGCTNSDCAVSWDGSPLELAQLSATFRLKPGLVWSDGEPLRAGDSIYSFQLASQCETDQGNCGGWGLSNRNGWEMLPRTASYTEIDDQTVQWTGVPGYLDSGYQANFFIPLPKHQLGQYELQELFGLPAAARQPLGWGPYALQSWVTGESISLRANPNYAGDLEGELRYDELLFRFIGSQPEGVNLVPGGACDLIDSGASRTLLTASYREVSELEQAGQLAAYYAAGPVWEHAVFGIQPISYDDGYLPGGDRPDFFSDARVRQAFALCMNREKVVTDLLDGLSSVPGSYLPPEHPLYLQEAAPYAYDPTAGGALLQEAGWIDHDLDPQTPRQAIGIQGIVDGTPLVVNYTTSAAEQRQASGSLLVESLAECGIQVDLNTGPAEVVYAPGPEGPVFGRRFDLAQFAWSASYEQACLLWTSRQIPGDPNLEDENGEAIFPYGWGGVNAGGFQDSGYDRACEAALGTLPGQEGYVENHHAVQAAFNTLLPVIPLFQQVNLVLSRSDMCGFDFDPSSFSEFWNIENFDHGPGC